MSKKDNKVISLRIPNDVYEKLIDKSEKDTRSIQKEIIHFIKSGVKNDKEK